MQMPRSIAQGKRDNLHSAQTVLPHEITWLRATCRRSSQLAGIYFFQISQISCLDDGSIVLKPLKDPEDFPTWLRLLLWCQIPWRKLDYPRLLDHDIWSCKWQVCLLHPRLVLCVALCICSLTSASMYLKQLHLEWFTVSSFQTCACEEGLNLPKIDVLLRRLGIDSVWCKRIRLSINTRAVGLAQYSAGVVFFFWTKQGCRFPGDMRICRMIDNKIAARLQKAFTWHCL